MLNMLAEITKISPSIPLIVALIASAVGLLGNVFWELLSPFVGM